MADEGENPSDMFINQLDGLDLQDASTANDDHLIINGIHDDISGNTLTSPNSIIIVTNVPENVFNIPSAKEKFESVVRIYDSAAQFEYLKNFRRSRIEFTSIDLASLAFSNLDNREMEGRTLKCYYAQPSVPTVQPVPQYLEPPPPAKQFLISPPASPPVGWEVIQERKPAINYDLLAAMAELGKSDSYELHTGNDSQPSIVVHVCEDPTGYEKRPTKIVQTRCPERKK